MSVLSFLRAWWLQVNMMLTIEEFCGEEGIFENTGEQGHLFEPVFAQVRAANPRYICST